MERQAGAVTGPRSVRRRAVPPAAAAEDSDGVIDLTMDSSPVDAVEVIDLGRTSGRTSNSGPAGRGTSNSGPAGAGAGGGLKRKPSSSPGFSMPTPLDSRTAPLQHKGALQISCAVCLVDSIERPATTNCGHVFCYECLMDVARKMKSCPLCSKRIATKDVHRLFLDAVIHGGVGATATPA